jgi:hypothetical protein
MANLEQSLTLLVEELLNDDDLRLSFLRDPAATLRAAGDWLPLTETELHVLRADPLVTWERAADALGGRLDLAA